jgi:hypothetical protein
MKAGLVRPEPLHQIRDIEDGSTLARETRQPKAPCRPQACRLAWLPKKDIPCPWRSSFLQRVAAPMRHLFLPQPAFKLFQEMSFVKQ